MFASRRAAYLVLAVATRVTHLCDQIAGRLHENRVKSDTRGRRIVVSSTGRAIPAVTLSAQQPARVAKSARNSLDFKILPLTTTRSRFCGEKFFPALCFQDFAKYGGRGGTPHLSVVGGQLSVFWHALASHHRGYHQSIAIASCQQPKAQGEDPKEGLA